MQVLTHEMMNSLTPISSPSESLESLLRTDAVRRAGRDRRGCRGARSDSTSAAWGSWDSSSAIARSRSCLPRSGSRCAWINCCRASIGLVSATLRDKGIEYRTVLSPPDLGVDADPQLLEQAVINLLRNAADAVVAVEREEGGAPPRIEVTWSVVRVR